MAPRARTNKKAQSNHPRFSEVKEDALQMIWVTVGVACKKTGFSRSTVLRLAGDPRNKIRTFLYKSHPDAQSGRRMLHLPDIVAFFARQAEQAQKMSSDLEETLK